MHRGAAGLTARRLLVVFKRDDRLQAPLCSAHATQGDDLLIITEWRRITIERERRCATPSKA
ncbi:hypothetical protein HMPREF0185_01344 [Brevundimonas diminuta 470-4]|nr:hypothetical protein HMPREF0185_01344 [Brevundimonas diminuta 470-4]